MELMAHTEGEDREEKGNNLALYLQHRNDIHYKVTLKTPAEKPKLCIPIIGCYLSARTSGNFHRGKLNSCIN